jgi:3-polyprenyl-4-hydroxybenzoate decarboxylase
MEEMKELVIQKIKELTEHSGDDTAFYSQILMACAQVPNDMEEALLIGMILNRSIMAMELSRIPVMGPIILDLIRTL